MCFISSILRRVPQLHRTTKGGPHTEKARSLCRTEELLELGLGSPLSAWTWGHIMMFVSLSTFASVGPSIKDTKNTFYDYRGMKMNIIQVEYIFITFIFSSAF